MLVLGRLKQGEDEVDSGHEDEAEDSEVDEASRDKSASAGNHLDILRYSQDLDLSGSYAARDRRRGKQVVWLKLQTNMTKYMYIKHMILWLSLKQCCDLTMPIYARHHIKNT